MFGKLKEKFTGGLNRLKGNTDLLEGVCAAGIIVAASDGSVSDDEGAILLDRLLNHEVISKAFSATQIEAAFDKQLKRASQGMTGRLALRREVEDVKAKSTSDDCELLLMIAIDVAMADGELDPKERAALNTVGQAIGFDPARYL